MQLALTILAGLGALVFLICFLGYVIAGFKHHFVTGLISMLPVLNIVTLPSLWDRNSRKFIIGFIALVITLGAWLLGADRGITNLLPNNNSTNEEVVISNTTISKTDKKNTKTVKKQNPKKTTSYNHGDLQELPSKALYKMGFEVVPINQISTLKGRIVQITKNNNDIIEGRVINIAAGSILIDGFFENELPIASIKELKLMVKKAN